MNALEIKRFVSKFREITNNKYELCNACKYAVDERNDESELPLTCTLCAASKILFFEPKESL